MKSILIVSMAFGLMRCATMERQTIAPQGKDEAETKEDVRICISASRRTYSSAAIQAYESCMKSMGYKFEYVEVKENGK